MQPDLTQLLQPHLLALAVISFLGCLGIIAFARVFPRLQGRSGDESAVQSMHVGLTPRVGGLAVFGTLAISTIFAPEGILQNYIELILATTLLFFVGLKEDLGFHASPRTRLLTVLAASLLVIVLSGAWLPRMGVPYVDTALSYWVFGVPFTLFITAGVSNGFNLIDGVNGLAGITATTSAVAIALVAQQAGFTAAASLSIMIAAVVLGFLALNYPFGLIFLGDAGAYTIGFVLSWFGIAVILHDHAVSPWAILLTLFWPLADTLLAMFRRSRGNRNKMQPDRLHFHQLVMRGIEICILGRGQRHISNSLTTLVMAPFVIAPQIIGVLIWNQNRLAFGVVLGFLALFFGTYVWLLRMIGSGRWRRHA